MPLNLAAARPLLAGALLVGALTACGGDSESSEASSPARPSDGVSATTEPAPEENVRRTVRAAVIRLFRDGTGTYTAESRMGGAAETSEEGRYDLRNRAWSMERWVSAPDVSAFIEIRRLPEDAWLRLDMLAPTKQQWGCWVNTDDIQNPDDGAIALPRTSPFPAPVVAAEGLVGRERTPTGFTGTLPLISAMGLLSNKFVLSGELHPRSKETVHVELTVVDDRLRMIRLQLLDLFTPLAEKDILPATPEQLERINGEIQVTFDDLGAPVSIPKPADVGIPPEC